MENMKFKTAQDNEDDGWTPLRFAMYQGRLDIARDLLALGANVHAPLARADPLKGWHVAGCTILQGLCFMRDFPEGIGLLMSRRADVLEQAERGFAAAHFTSATGRCQNLDAIAKQ